jgi:mRNA interferase MazF
VFLVDIDPVAGAETAKTRPCVIISPDEMNRALKTVIIAPLTTVLRGWPTRIPVSFRQKSGEVALDQIRAVDKVRLVKFLGKLSAKSARESLEVLGEMFSP